MLCEHRSAAWLLCASTFSLAKQGQQSQTQGVGNEDHITNSIFNVRKEWQHAQSSINMSHCKEKLTFLVLLFLNLENRVEVTRKVNTV